MLCLKKISVLGKCSSNMGNFSPIKKYLPGACHAVNGPEFVSFSQVLLLLLLEENMYIYIFRAHKDNFWFSRRLIVWSWIGFSFPLWKQDTVCLLPRIFQRCMKEKVMYQGQHIRYIFLINSLLFLGWGNVM